MQHTVDEQRGVATIVDEQVWAAAIGPGEHLLRAPPVLLQRLALPCEHGGAVPRAGGGGMVLRNPRFQRWVTHNGPGKLPVLGVQTQTTRSAAAPRATLKMVACG